MKELIFSVCNDLGDVLKVLMPFNQNRPANAQVKLHGIPWDNHKQELTAMAIYGQAADVSQVGGPLVNDLIAMKSLKSFSSREINLMGGISSFNKIAWENSLRSSEGLIYAFPWIIDPRAIIYWRDMLEEAHVDENTAFASFDQMEETFDRLQESGVKTPWVIQMDKLVAFHAACTWIWGAGGEIGNETDLSILDPKALAGLQKYFSLYRYMNQTESQLDSAPYYIEMFSKQRAAVTITNLGNYQYIKGNLPANMQERLGVALAPGPFFLGSSSLVVWRTHRDEADVVSLVEYLLGGEAQKEYCTRAGFLPTRTSVLDEEPFSTDPALQVFVKSMLNGRTISNLKLSGLLEDLLSTAVGHIWRNIITNPNVELEAVIRAEVEPVVRRASFWNE